MKHNKVRSTKTPQTIERNKSISNNTFRAALFILASLILFFSILVIVFIIGKGLEGVSSIWNNGQWLFGNKYDGVELFAAGFMVINTLWTSILAVLVALPISVLTAIFITRIAPKSFRTFFFVVLSILAAIPSVIYGAFGAKAIDAISMFLFHTTSGSLLTIVFTLAFMIMPTITLITTSSINSVDKKMEASSLALGATRNQTSFHITIRAVSTGILTASILGIGRAIGEATAVSMISVDPYTGPTFGLFENIRLLTATMLKGYNEMEPGSQQEASMFALGMMLIITILFVFITMRYLQRVNSPEEKSKKASKRINKTDKLNKEIEEKGLANISVHKQKQYYKRIEKLKFNDKLNEYYHSKYRKERIVTNTTIKTTHEGKKQTNSKMLGILTWSMAMVGVVFLFSIIAFLLILGVPGLNWVFITSNDEGIRTALFGTILLIGLSMLFIIPLGVGSGLYFSVFAKDNKVTRVLLTGIDILAGIPSLIFGLIGAAVFIPLANAINFAPIAGALILSFIVIPTVIQTTRESINSVPRKTVNGSLALGSTKTTSSIRLVLPQSMPQIISGIILSIGRIIGESAAIVMIFGTVSRATDSEWIKFGGTTLATEMYSLTLMEEIDWNAIAAIGVIILTLILVLALLADYISHKQHIATLGILASLIIMLAGIFVSEEIGLIIFTIGAIVLVLTVVLTTIYKRRKI